MTDLSILDENTDDTVEPREPPHGEYLAQITDIEANTDKTPFAQIEFKLIEAMQQQDLTGVNLNRPIYTDKLWLSEKAKPYTKRDLMKFGVDIKGLKWRDSFDKLQGTTAVVTVAADEYWASKGRDRSIVKSWRAA